MRGRAGTARPATVPAAVEEIARRAPGSLALVDEGERVDYATLLRASEVLAGRLVEHGVQPGDIVPLLVPRSVALVALQLAVLRAGAAYTTLDPQWPESRLRSIIARLDRAVVLGPADAERVGVTHPVDPPVLTELAADAGGLSEASTVTVESGDAACVFFTSGSTGVPKGVVVSHAALTRMFGAGGLDGFGPGHVTPVMAPPAWDMYGFELWGQLTTGGTCRLVRENLLMPRSLRELIAHDGVDTAWLTSSLFNLLVDEDVASFEGIVTLYVGGERLSPRHVGAFLARHPEVRLWNGYGPAENGMLTTVHPITPADVARPSGIPIGRPVRGTDVVLLGEGDARTPTGEVGEIVALGEGVALGYLNDEAQTAARFASLEIDGAFVPAYRTGDFGEFDDSAVLHYRGRRDRQVKVRGHRVELGEVEAVAGRIGGVGTCAAVVHRGADGEADGITLFYSATDGPAPSPRAVRAQLAEALPRYAVPGRVELIDELPRTDNGKADLRELGDRALRAGRRDG